MALLTIRSITTCKTEESLRFSKNAKMFNLFYSFFSKLSPLSFYSYKPMIISYSTRLTHSICQPMYDSLDFKLTKNKKNSNNGLSYIAVDLLMNVLSPGDSLVVWRGGKESSTGSF